MSDKKGTLVFSSSTHKDLVIAIGDDVKVLFKLEDGRLKAVIEAPKEIKIRNLKVVSEALAKMVG